jgi:hypothetical protein
MFSKYIKHIKSKPAHVRKGITLGISFGITGVIAFFWFISFLNYTSQILSREPVVESPTSFISKMGAQIGESFVNAKNTITNKGATSSGGVGESTSVETNENSSNSTDENINENTNGGTSTNYLVDETEVNSESEPQTKSETNSIPLQDILNTKKQVNQENKATTSSEVLVQ